GLLPDPTHYILTPSPLVQRCLNHIAYPFIDTQFNPLVMETGIFVVGPTMLSVAKKALPKRSIC
ncbi:hypothetical protein, partial [Candidatus Synechococcus spongiarum]|uniref:hypothetical protein n=1 Tax=Candidatus Synechococcus spongiarum TaxID=431041 RepID=UPI001C55CB6F